MRTPTVNRQVTRKALTTKDVYVKRCCADVDDECIENVIATNIDDCAACPNMVQNISCNKRKKRNQYNYQIIYHKKCSRGNRLVIDYINT